MPENAEKAYEMYLHLPELLSLQQPRSGRLGAEVQASELFFIAVHQSAELLLGTVLTDLRHALLTESGDAPSGADAEAALRRATAVVRMLRIHIEILEHLPRAHFEAFRGLLGTASAGGSVQFAELFQLAGGDGGAALRSRVGHAASGVDSSGDLRALRSEVRSWQRAHIALVQRMIGLAPGTGGTAGVAWLRSRVPSAPGASKPLPAPRRRRVHANPAAMSVAETLGAVAAGTSSAEDQARRCAIACAGDTLRAFTQVDAASALREARECDRRAREEHSPLRGVVLAVKDNIDAAGFATTAGTPALTGHRPHRDAPVVQALRAAGAVVVGKTNMHELAYGATSDNAVYGRVRHPVRPELIAGGSSGGSAAAVAGGLVTAALGTETGCSVRVPAALCGLVGFRPTTGAYPAAGVVPVSWTRDTVGLLARTVEDIRILDAVCRAQTHRAAFTAVLGRLRLAAPHQPFCSGMPAALRSVFEARLRELEDAGVEIVECELPEEAMPAAAASSLPIALYETPRGIERYLGAHGLTLRFPEIAAQVASPDVAELLQPIATRGIDEDAYHEALALHRERLRLLLHRFLADQNLNGLIVPSAPITAPRLIPGDRIELDGRPVAAFPLLVRNADISSILGWPAISLPAAHPGHALPFGIDLQFPTGADDDLLAAAAEIESVWNQEPS